MTNSDIQTLVSTDQSYLTVITDDRKTRFHASWLRDNALDEETRAAGNGQKLISLLSQPETSLINSARIESNNSLIVSFVDNPVSYHYPLDWLQRNRYDRDHAQILGWVSKSHNLWDHSLNESRPTGNYESLAQHDDELYSWLKKIERYGFALLDHIPPGADGLLKVTDLFGYVRETNYGKCFDVRSEVNPINLAYTGLGLQAHTDNPYRDPVPTMQILACMENTADGGESVVVDGFQATTQLREESQRHFDLLSQYPVRFSYTGAENVSLQSKRPMIELGVDGELIAVRFNNRSAAPFTDIPFELMPQFYQAYRHLSEIIGRKTNQVTFKLKPRQLFIVDNTRVLHSRTAFSGSGSRWLRGCYPDKDGMLSTLHSLGSKLNDII